MSVREDLVTELAGLEARRAHIARVEERWHRVFMSAPDAVARALGPKLEEVCQKLDDLSDAIGVLKARLYLIDANQTRRAKLWDAAYYGGPT